MSDYEDEDDYSSMETDEFVYSDVEESVVSHLSVTIKRNQTTRDIPVYIKYYDRSDAVQAELDGYRYNMYLIANHIDRLYPGWSIFRVQSEGYSDNSYFDLDASENE
ncbi:MAG: hypothetical protein PHG66_02005 [Candidatus Colwellbacteria bacterium]|nr:hypothetical protein [Candidatus Colwellbacteria bacterium]